MAEKHKMNMLVVDDTEMNRVLIKENFKDEFNIFEAANGIEALQVLKDPAANIEVVLLDIVMPQMDGFATLTEMRKIGVLGKIPVVAMTSDESAINDLNAIDFGADDVIAKPFINVLFKKRVMNAIESFLYRKQAGNKAE